MVKIDHRIMAVGLICLTAIYMTLVICKQDTQAIGVLIVGTIGAAIGVFIPSPKIDNKRGVIQW